MGQLRGSFLALPAAVAVGFALQAPAFAQPPDAAVILKEAQVALQALKTVRYQATNDASGFLAVRYPQMTGVIIAERAAGVPRGRIRADVAVKPRSEQSEYRFEYATDGATARIAHYGSKEFTQATLAGNPGALAPVSIIHIDEFSNETPLSDELKATNTAYVGTQDVSGEACEVVQVDYGDARGKARWYFSKQDRLPRRVQLIQPSPGGESIVTITVDRLEPNPKVGADQFTLERPDGFTDASPPAGGGATGASASGGGDRSGLLDLGSEAPDWTLKDAEGNDVTLKSLRGKVVLIDFWATWCGPCKMIMPRLQKLHERMKDRPFVMLGVSTWERNPNADPAGFMKNAGYTYRTLLKGDGAAQVYRVRGIPTLYVIDPDGKILHRHSGAAAAEMSTVESIVEQAVKKLEASKGP